MYRYCIHFFGQRSAHHHRLIHTYRYKKGREFNLRKLFLVKTFDFARHCQLFFSSSSSWSVSSGTGRQPTHQKIMDPISLSSSSSSPSRLSSTCNNNNSNNTDNPHALEKAQDDLEMFEVMKPPPPTSPPPTSPSNNENKDFDMFHDRPETTGIIKARHLVHQDWDWHRSVHVWVVDCTTRHVVMQKRSPQKDTFPNRWDISAAGHIEYLQQQQQKDHESNNNNNNSNNNNNDNHDDNNNNNNTDSDTDSLSLSLSSSRETAVREVAEELGIVCTKEELLFAYTCPAEQAPLGGCNCYEDVYFLKRNQNELNFAIGQAEVSDVKWISIDELKHAWENNNNDNDNDNGNHDNNVSNDNSNDLFVPRVEKYRHAFFNMLSTLCSS